VDTVRRVVIFVEWALISLFALMLLMRGMEFYSAWHSQSCFIKFSQNCYPWGMTEGPMEGGSWGYTSKENYLVSNFVVGAFISVLLILCFVIPRNFRIVVLVSGLIAARFAEQISIFAKPYLVEFLNHSFQT
jgi:hypothetical protein